MSAWRWLAVGGTALAAACVGFAGASTPAPSPDEVLDALVVRTGVVTTAPETRSVALHGVTRASDRGELAFTVGGRLGSRRVALGDAVRAGQVLAVLDTRAYDNGQRAAEATVTELEARLTQLDRDRARLDTLEAGRTVSQAELDRVATEQAAVRASLDAARASATEAGRQRGEAVLTAPFDGVVSAVYVEPGEATSPGVPILQLTGDAGLEVEVQVPERVWATLAVGDTAEVELPALGRAVPAAVRQVGGAARPGGLFPVVVALSEPGAAGLTARVHLDVPVGAGLAVPVAAVVDPTGTAPAVFRVTGEVVERIPVAPAALLGDTVAVAAGDLAADDAVVVAGQGRLLDGDRVRVLP